MLQRSTLSTSANTEIAQTLQRTLERSWLRSLQQTVQLPETWQQYMLLLVIAVLVTGALAWQVLLATQTAATRHQLRLLRVEYEHIERQNSELVYQIATQSTMRQVQVQAAAQGFGPATSRLYVARPVAATAVTASPPPGKQIMPAASTQNAALKAPPSASWFDQGRQWWLAAQESAQTGLSQLVRDVTGRMR